MYKYKYYRADNKVIAVSSFAGRVVKGVAKCDPADVFSVERGEELAAARCNNKIAAKRVKCAKRKREEALKAFNEAKEYLATMDNYYDESVARYAESIAEVENIIAKLN